MNKILMVLISFIVIQTILILEVRCRKHYDKISLIPLLIQSIFYTYVSNKLISIYLFYLVLGYVLGFLFHYLISTEYLKKEEIRLEEEDKRLLKEKERLERRFRK